MSGTVNRKHMIFFEANGVGYAVQAADLAGVGNACPFTNYPGLPPGVAGIVQWSGKIYPVIQPFGDIGVDLRSCAFIFSIDGLKAAYGEIAVAVPGNVRVFFAETIEQPPCDAPDWVVGVVKDSAGTSARFISLGALAQSVVAPSPNRKNGGKKVAA